MMPVRVEASGFAATEYSMTPGLVPVVAPVSVIQGVDVVVFHEQPFGVLRLAVNVKRVPPVAGTLCLVGERV